LFDFSKNEIIIEQVSKKRGTGIPRPQTMKNFCHHHSMAYVLLMFLTLASLGSTVPVVEENETVSCAECTQAPAPSSSLKLTLSDVLHNFISSYAFLAFVWWMIAHRMMMSYRHTLVCCLTPCHSPPLA
jgi:hypothetical protein